jgi:hypothetical protein
MEKVLWCTDPLLCKDLETNNVTDVACTALAMWCVDNQRYYATVYMERIGKHVPAATNTHNKDLLLDTVFLYSVRAEWL